jgi:hypothetical protein
VGFMSEVYGRKVLEGPPGVLVVPVLCCGTSWKSFACRSFSRTTRQKSKGVKSRQSRSGRSISLFLELAGSDGGF